MSGLELAVVSGVHRRTIGVIVFIGGLDLCNAPMQAFTGSFPTSSISRRS